MEQTRPIGVSLRSANKVCAMLYASPSGTRWAKPMFGKFDGNSLILLYEQSNTSSVCGKFDGNSVNPLH